MIQYLFQHWQEIWFVIIVLLGAYLLVNIIGLIVVKMIQKALGWDHDDDN